MAKAAAKSSKKKQFKKKEKKNVPYGIVNVQASFNNTIVTITDTTGNTLSCRPRVCAIQTSSRFTITASAITALTSSWNSCAAKACAR